ncbi:MAG: hypothetical protein HFACDABA_02225 [Anaerolineales bacterium]|nr:hypothetical protein [Anaerolineales bacterium]
MPDLLVSLYPYDLGHLRIIAECWGIELNARARDAAANELAASLLDPQRVRETIEVLPRAARPALDALLAARGRIAWAEFSRRFGNIREMGAAKRDREQPHRKPVSAAEILFYRGLLAKAFFDTAKGSQEFAYIPGDLLKIITREERQENVEEVLGRPATPAEKAFEIPASDRILDDATTLLAGLRVGNANWPRSLSEEAQLESRLLHLLHAAKLLKKNNLQPEAVKRFLEAPRAEALSILVEAWKASDTFDELRLLPGLLCEGEWENNPRSTRQTLLNFIQGIPENQWWSFPAFLRDLKLKRPDFQRPAGDYDSWFIKRAADGQYLRGFAYWDAVEGALARFLIEILHSLGLVDIASPGEDKDFTAFRVRSAFSFLSAAEKGKIAIASNGKISVARLAPRAARYQIARFCEWDSGDLDTPFARVRGYPTASDDYIYRVSARSLKHANQQGLKASQLLSLLAKHTSGNVPPTLVKSLNRWEANGSEARAENQIVLRVTRPEVLEELRKSKAARFLGEALGPTAIIVKAGALSKVEAALAELGLLLEVIESPGL